MTEIGVAYVNVVPKTDGFSEAVADASKDAGKSGGESISGGIFDSLKSTAGDLFSTGGEMGSSLSSGMESFLGGAGKLAIGAAVAGIGVAALTELEKVGAQIDEMTDTIIVGTGASGEQLEAMLLKYLPPERVTTSDASASQSESDGALPAWLLSSEALGNVLDVKAGLQFCGSAEDYLAVLRVFQESAAENADEIQRLFEAKDWKNYTTKVHALKSSARAIGAAELSDRAARLEDAGNRLYVEEIAADTPLLLALYRASGEALAPLKEPKQNDESLPEIDMASLREAYAAIREMASSFDYKSIQFVLDDLAKNRIPQEAAERHARLVEAAKKLDWDGLKKILEEA